MREVELWRRLGTHLGDAYALAWAEQATLASLNSRTVRQALADGHPVKDIWRAAWEALELPFRDR